MDVTPMHVAFEEVKKDADDLSIAVTGSELVRDLSFKRKIIYIYYLKLHKV